MRHRVKCLMRLSGKIDYPMKRIAFAISTPLLLAGCYSGDPRTTELENRANSLITVHWVDDLGRKRQVDATIDGTADLWPNYRFEDLRELTIIENRTAFKFTLKELKKLRAECFKSCTLSYWGSGRLKIVAWNPSI